ncbi:lipase family protein [Mycobacterium colombiense]
MVNPGLPGENYPPQAPHEIDWTRPQSPCDDGFCRPPEGFEATPPGAVLRSREVRIAFLGLVPQEVIAYQLLYRTTDMNGAPQATVTTIIRTAGSPPDPTAPVVSYQCAIDSLASTGFPSYVLRRGARLVKVFGGPPAWEYIPMACALSRGWRVLVPDHGGGRGSWIAPREPGYCVLDGIRAAQNFEPAGIAPAAPVALWGYSGGGLASSWAAELWFSYARELNVVGAVLGAPVGDPGAVFKDLDGSPYAGLSNLAVASLIREYPGLQQIVQAHINDSGQSWLTQLESLTMIGALARGCLRKAGRHLDRPLDEILTTPAIAHMFDELRLGQTAPAMPVLVFQAIHDEFISVRHIDALVDKYRARGGRVSYLRDRLSEHALLYPLSIPTGLQWISDRFAGKPDVDPGTRAVTLVLSPRTIIGVLSTLWMTLKVLLGRPLSHERRPAERDAPRHATDS